MSVRDICIGMLLGDGGIQDITFREIINNSRLVKTIPINEHFRFTLNAMFICPDAFTKDQAVYPAFDSVRHGFPNINVRSGSVSGRFIYNPYFVWYLIGYEDDVPKFAHCNGGRYWSNGFISQGGSILTQYSYHIDMDSIVLNHDLILWRETDTYFQERFYAGDDPTINLYNEATAVLVTQYYSIIDGGGALYISRKTTETVSLSLSSNTSPIMNRVYTELSCGQYTSLYTDMVKAIYEEHGKTYTVGNYVPILNAEV